MTPWLIHTNTNTIHEPPFVVYMYLLYTLSMYISSSSLLVDLDRRFWDGYMEWLVHEDQDVVDNDYHR